MPNLSEICARCALGIDPGLAATGYAVVTPLAKGGRLDVYGSIKTSPKLAVPARLQIIYEALGELIQKWQPGLLVLEDIFVLGKFPKAAIQLGEVTGVISLAAQLKSIEVLKLQPTEIKRSLTGNGRASKDQLSATLKRYLRIKQDIRPDHASDAAALALTGLSRLGRYRW